MSRTILASAKISRPRLSGLVARERLFDCLDRARQRRLVWIAAQPGAGKTALVASYMDARSVTGIWYQVDGGDSDPATFFYYLRQAATRVANDKKLKLPLLTPEYRKNGPAS